MQTAKLAQRSVERAAMDCIDFKQQGNISIKPDMLYTNHV